MTTLTKGAKVLRHVPRSKAGRLQMAKHAARMIQLYQSHAAEAMHSLECSEAMVAHWTGVKHACLGGTK